MDSNHKIELCRIVVKQIIAYTSGMSYMEALKSRSMIESEIYSEFLRKHKIDTSEDEFKKEISILVNTIFRQSQYDGTMSRYNEFIKETVDELLSGPKTVQVSLVVGLPIELELNKEDHEPAEWDKFIEGINTGVHNRLRPFREIQFTMDMLIQEIISANPDITNIIQCNLEDLTETIDIEEVRFDDDIINTIY